MEKISILAVYISMVHKSRRRAILAGALQGRFCPFRVEACNSERYGNLNSAVPACITKDSVPKVTPSYVRLVTSLQRRSVRLYIPQTCDSPSPHMGCSKLPLTLASPITSNPPVCTTTTATSDHHHDLPIFNPTRQPNK